MAVSRTPFEVWSQIIGDSARVWREGHDMPLGHGTFTLMSVSKTWKDLAAPYLLLDIRFYTIAKLHLFLHALQSDPRFRSRVSKYTRGVFIHIPTPTDDSRLADVYTLLSHIRQLDTLVCRFLDVTTTLPLVLASARPMPGGSYNLQVLDIQLQVGWASLLRQFGQFTGLRELHIRLDKDVEDPPPDDGLISQVPAWSMPHLRLLSWQALTFMDDADHERHAAWLHLLARSSFPALREVRFALFPLEAGSTPAIRRFFWRHGAHLERVALLASLHGIADVVDFVRAPQLVIETTCPEVSMRPAPCQDIIAALGPEVKEIVFLAYPGFDDLTEFLNAIEKARDDEDAAEGLLKVVVRYRPCDGRDEPDGARHPRADDEGEIRLDLAERSERWEEEFGLELRDELDVFWDGSASARARVSTQHLASLCKRTRASRIVRTACARSPSQGMIAPWTPST